MQAAKFPKSEKTTLDDAIAWFEQRLPEGWAINRYAAEDREVASRLSVQARDGAFGSIAVEVRDSLSPREASNLLPGFGRVLRSMVGGTALLVVAPWLSERTREVLAKEKVNYIDLTGNSLVRLDSPSLYIETVGASRNPSPRSRGAIKLQGRRAARLIRLLADVQPPYGVSDLAKATDLAPGYISQLLNALYREALIERAPRGPVETVDIAGLLRRWARSYDVFKTNDAEMFIAPSGPAGLLPMLRKATDLEPEFVVTGSAAASRLAPVTSPSTLLAYCDQPAALAEILGLLPTEEGANVVLLKPFDSVVWDRTSAEDGLRFAAPSQVAVDCLTGNGRMPAEGEALVEWMLANEGKWRLDALPKDEGSGDETRP